MSSTRRRVSQKDVTRAEALEQDLIGAGALAEFANLQPTGVASFRARYPDFAPAEWWDYFYMMDGMRVLRAEDVIKLSPNDPNLTRNIENKVVRQWQHTQQEIRRAWKAEFKFKNASEISGLLKSVFCVDRPGLLWNSSQVMLPNGTIFELNSKLYQFHKAVLYLHQHPWRAKVCQQCRKRFVADHASRKYCSVASNCSAQVIKDAHLKWGRANNWGRPKSKSKGR